MSPTEIGIIGNGFDLALGLPTSFAAFEEHVRENEPYVHQAIENFLPVDGEWRDLEEAFAWFDGHRAMDEAAEHLVSYGADDWSDAYHHAPQREAEQIAEYLTNGIRNQLLDWARVIDTYPVVRPVTIQLAADIPYLTFNYTRTLQRVFRIPDRKVLHIHGQASQGGPLVLGHARPPAGSRDLQSPYDNEDGDVRMLEAGQILDEVIDHTCKASAAIIKTNGSFFSALSDVAYVRVLGHSLAEVDHPYFAAVAEQARPNATWQVSCYSDEDHARAEHLRAQLGVHCSRWSTFDLCDWLKLQ